MKVTLTNYSCSMELSVLSWNPSVKTTLIGGTVVPTVQPMDKVNTIKMNLLASDGN